MSDERPICNCGSYNFPHRVGGKCSGDEFTEYYFYHIQTACRGCNCFFNNECQVSTGQESINEAECYAEYFGDYLPLGI